MITDKLLKRIATILTLLNCSTILTLNQFSWNKNYTKKIYEKSLYIIFFGLKNKRISFDITFRNYYFFIKDFKIYKTNGIATVSITNN